MVEVIPIMLLIIGWLPDAPGEIGLERPELVFESVEACEAIGAKMAARMTEAARDKSGALYEHRCLPVPNADEYEKLFEQMDAERKARGK